MNRKLRLLLTFLAWVAFIALGILLFSMEHANLIAGGAL